MPERGARSVSQTAYGQEIRAHYKTGKLTPETVLTGHFHRELNAVDLEAVRNGIEDVKLDEDARLMRMRAAD